MTQLREQLVAKLSNPQRGPLPKRENLTVEQVRESLRARASKLCELRKTRGFPDPDSSVDPRKLWHETLLEQWETYQEVMGLRA